MNKRTLMMAACLCLPPMAPAATPLQPGGDDEVLEVLNTVTRQRPAAPPAGQAAAAPGLSAAQAQRQAREHITAARTLGDTRYWGRAQAVLAPWWDAPDAPVELAVLQATVQQGVHRFDASRRVLTAALQRAPDHAQAWLTLASLERLSGQYAASLKACDAVAQAGQERYAAACRLETRSLTEEPARITQGFQALVAQTSDAGQRSWLLSLQAEHLERAGQDARAAQAYRQSLALQADLYTAIAFGDLLLRTGQTAQALAVLAPLPETDAVLLRRGAAWRRTGDTRWQEVRAELKNREAELRRRGDDPLLHARELALTALWLDDDAPAALALARQNLQLQREPLDWWVALQAASRADNTAAWRELSAGVQAVGLRDQRLPLAATPEPVVKP